VSPDNMAAARELPAAGLLLDIREVSRVDDLPAVLADLLPRVDVLLGLADARLFTPDTARLILLASYRQQTPLIGPDEAFVRAGSLAAAHPSLEGLASAVIELLSRFNKDGPLPAPRYAPPTLTINAHVARSYGVIAPDTATIEQRLENTQ
jgi:putative tryptophan/tyrosine transport system substrate-binding protein